MKEKKILGPFIVTTTEDEVNLDEAIEYELRENQVVGFAVDTLVLKSKISQKLPKTLTIWMELFQKALWYLRT